MARTLATGSWDSTVRLWDVATGTRRHSLQGHTDWIQHMAFSPDNRTLASGGGWNTTVRLWDVTTGTLRHSLPHNRRYNLQGHRDRIGALAFSPDGQILATGSWGGVTRLWDMATGSSSWGSTIRLWDTATGTLQHSLLGHTGRVSALAFSPDGQTLASGSWDGTVLLWDVAAWISSPLASGDFRNQETNPDGHWEVWENGTTVTAAFSSQRSPVQYYARQNPQPQFVLPTDSRPARQVTHTVTGTRVQEDRTPVSNAQPAIFDLTIGTNGEVRYVDNAKVDDLGYVSYYVHLTWQTHENQEMPPTSELGENSGPDTEPDQ